MKSDIRRSITVEAKEHGLSGQMMKWLLKSQGRLEGRPGTFRATPEYKQFEHNAKSTWGYAYDSEFFEGVDYSEAALDEARTQRENYKIQMKPWLTEDRQNEQSREVMKNATQKRSLLSKIIHEIVWRD